MLYFFYYTGEVLPTAGVHSIPAKLCSLQGTHLIVNSAQRSNFYQLQYHMHANPAQHSQVRCKCWVENLNMCFEVCFISKLLFMFNTEK